MVGPMHHPCPITLLHMHHPCPVVLLHNKDPYPSPVSMLPRLPPHSLLHIFFLWFFLLVTQQQSIIIIIISSSQKFDHLKVSKTLSFVCFQLQKRKKIRVLSLGYKRPLKPSRSEVDELLSTTLEFEGSHKLVTSMSTSCKKSC